MPRTRAKRRATPIRARLFWEGAFVGLLGGIALEAGVSIEEDDLRLRVLHLTCEALNDGSGCGALVGILSVLALLLSLYALFAECSLLKKAKYLYRWQWPPWAEGLAFHLVGMILTFIATLVLL
ncbi:MAG: hypothetical protein OXR66_01200 [Candidatus Woesearchaeota archaeon]|nr:hypothetical protein [Candidatus Woesearchaeota archaeon]